MGTGGAKLGSLGAYHEMAAVAALPHLDLALGEDLGGFHILQQSAVALLVMLFNGGDQAELGSQLGETLLLGGLGETGVHVGPLIVFAGSGGSQILGGITDAFQLLEPHLSVLFFIVRSLQEQGRDLLIAFLLGLGCKIGVLVAGFGFAGEGGPKIFFGLGACIFVCHGNNLLHIRL